MVLVMKLLSLFLIALCLASYASAQNRKPASSQLYDTIFSKPTVFASYPGGDTAWKKYVKTNMKYPRKAWWEAVETDIIVRVIIDKDGSIVLAQHLNTAGYGFEKEAVRLVMKSGKWIPARHNGVAVKSEGVLKIEFRLK